MSEPGHAAFDFRDRSADFGPFSGNVWLNCAHQAPLPKVAADAARAAVDWKVQPWELTTERFSGVPARLRAALATLIDADPAEIILANSASYGLHLLANGIDWRDGDEVLCMRGDFPSDILPWLGLERLGVRVRQLEPRGAVLSADEVARAITPRTRLLCTTWVHSFSGHAIDLDAVGGVCRAHGVIFVANVSQALGARSLNVARAPVDAIVCAGWKWLCGPYATGFCWLRPELCAGLVYNQTYWLAMLTSDDLGRETLDLSLAGNVGARRYDVFGTANFFNFAPFAAAIEYLLAIGIDAVRDHDNALVDRFVAGLPRKTCDLLSPMDGPARSTLVLVSAKDRARNRDIHRRLAAAGIHVAFRAGSLRIAPHIYNTPDDIDRALAALARA
ncbi:MAG: aminotransferase class V-fold PLP-dependent enzyme [Rhodospirillales bacterium]|nr:aminotransferase class V-fold PLP-dependent enzyme [Rhodospirillales bacterium]